MPGAQEVGGSNSRRSSFSFRRRNAYVVSLVSMKTDKTGSSRAGSLKKARRRDEKKRKEFERGAKHTRKKEDGLDINLIKWLMPSGGECGVKKLLK